MVLINGVAVFHLPPQVADVHVDGAVEGCGFAVVEVFHQSVAREHVPGVPHQQLQDVELERGELDRFALDERLTRAWIERHALDFKALAGFGAARSAAGWHACAPPVPAG